MKLTGWLIAGALYLCHEAFAVFEETELDASHMDAAERGLRAGTTAALRLDYGNHCFYRVKGKEEYVFQATMKRVEGEVVYQAYDNTTCEPMERFLVLDQYKGKPRWVISKSMSYRSGRNLIGRVKGFSGDGRTCDKVGRKVTFAGRQGTGTLELDTEVAACDPIVERAPELPQGGADCMYDMSGFENYVFRATTSRSDDGEVVYQALHNETCEPLNRYLYHEAGGWAVSDTAEKDSTSKHRLATFKGDWSGCNTDVLKIANFAARKEGYSMLTLHTGTPCGYSGRYDGLKVVLKTDRNNDCIYHMTGYENFTFRPTTRKMGGEPVYQGWDLKLCKALPRFLYRTVRSGKGQWNVDNDLSLSRYDRMGFVEGDWSGCDPNNKKVVLWESDEFSAELKYDRGGECY